MSSGALAPRRRAHTFQCVNDFLKAIERLANAKGIAALLVLLLVAFFVYRNVDLISGVTFTVNRDTSSAVQRAPATPRGNAAFEIASVQLAPIDFALPSPFIAEIRNSGQEAGGGDVIVDFGGASIEQFEVQPAAAATLVSGGTGAGTLKLRLPNVSRGESIYIYALLSSPTFRRIVVNADESHLQTTLEHSQYLARQSGAVTPEPGFVTFLWVLAGLFIIVMSFYLTIVLITFLNGFFFRQRST